MLRHVRGVLVLGAVGPRSAVSLPLVVALLALAGLLTHYGIIRQVSSTNAGAILRQSGCRDLARDGPVRLDADFRTITNPIVPDASCRRNLSSASRNWCRSRLLLAFHRPLALCHRTETGVALQATAQDRGRRRFMGIRRSHAGSRLGHRLAASPSLKLLANFYYVFPTSA